VAATYEDVDAIAAELPKVTVGLSWGNRTWMVGGKGFVWERPFTKADVKRFGDDPIPSGPILGVRVEDLSEKEAILASGTKGVFTIAHFDGFAGLLVQLDAVGKRALRELVLDAWLAVAPPKLATEYLAGRRRR
jgi:hypothetical protein